MKKNGKNNIKYTIQIIKLKKINKNQISKNKCLYWYHKNTKSILILYFFILFFSTSLNFYLRKINSMQEITLTLSNNMAEITILSDDFNSLPDEIYIGGQKVDQVSKSIHLNGQNTIKLCYNTVPNSLRGMFKDLRCVTKIDFSNFDSSNVQDMSLMFKNCQDLENVVFNNFKTTNVRDMEGMFQSCQKINSLDLSSFDTSSVTNMKYMFQSCEGLRSLNILSFDTSQVTDMAEMFCDCQNMNSLDLSNFRTNSKVDMGGMFKYCITLTSISFPKNYKLISGNMG